MQDCIGAATALADEGLADPQQLLIMGGSAGGYTTLMVLATSDCFAAGADLYGVADVAALARDTHKFESHYTDRLIGPYPQAAEIYRQRSPLTHVDGFNAPLLVLQGEEDEVVPPAQSEVIVAALDAKRIPHVYLTFPGEQHGFRSAQAQTQSIEATLWFFRRVLGLPDPESMPPLPVNHADRLRNKR